jgi:hypothetical protein
VKLSGTISAADVGVKKARLGGLGAIGDRDGRVDRQRDGGRAHRSRGMV